MSGAWPWAELAALDAVALQGALLDGAEERLAGLEGPDEAAALAALPEPVRVIWLLGALDFEVSQGSLLAYFYNSAGRYAAEAAAALELIGARRMAGVVREARASMGDERAATGDVEFAVVHPYAGLSNADVLERLTDEYWEAADADDWGEKLDAYLVGAMRERAEGRAQS